MARYKGDPHWITVRYAGTCRRCGRALRKGDRAFYYPRGKDMYCEPTGCGGVAESDFRSAAFDESVTTGVW